MVWSMKVIATAKIIAARTRFLGYYAAVPGTSWAALLSCTVTLVNLFGSRTRPYRQAKLPLS